MFFCRKGSLSAPSEWIGNQRNCMNYRHLAIIASITTVHNESVQINIEFYKSANGDGMIHVIVEFLNNPKYRWDIDEFTGPLADSNKRYYRMRPKYIYITAHVSCHGCLIEVSPLIIVQFQWCSIQPKAYPAKIYAVKSTPLNYLDIEYARGN